MNNFGYVLVSKMLISGNHKVQFMYREMPDNPQDSGWRFFTGDEDDDYISDPENFAVYDINTILAIDDSVLPYLQVKAEIAFIRKKDSDEFSVMNQSA